MNAPVTINYEYGKSRSNLGNLLGKAIVTGHITEQIFADEVLPAILAEDKEIYKVVFNQCTFDTVVIDLPLLLRVLESYSINKLRVTFKQCNFIRSILTGQADAVTIVNCTTSGHTSLSEAVKSLIGNSGLSVHGLNTRLLVFENCNMKLSLEENVIGYLQFVGHSGDVAVGLKISKADLAEELKRFSVVDSQRLRIQGHNPFITLFDMGRDSRALHYNAISDVVVAGCFRGSLDEFEAAVTDTYTKDKVKAKEYEALFQGGSTPINYSHRSQRKTYEQLEKLERNYRSAIDLLRAKRETYLETCKYEDLYDNTIEDGILTRCCDTEPDSVPGAIINLDGVEHSTEIAKKRPAVQPTMMELSTLSELTHKPSECEGGDK